MGGCAVEWKNNCQVNNINRCGVGDIFILVEEKMPSQMDVAPWCYKWDGMDGLVCRWGEV